MTEIIALFTIFIPDLSPTTLRQFYRVVFALLAMSGRVTMKNISRWTPQGGSYRTIQRFFNTVIPWSTICWKFFYMHLFDRESVYILAGDETTELKSGPATYGISRFFSSIYGKPIPGLAFLAVSLVSVKQRRSYPMAIEQIVRGNSSSTSEVSASENRLDTETTPAKRKRGRPPGSKNKNKKDVVLSETLTQLQKMVKALLTLIGDLLPIRYFVLDGYFGHNNALQMVKQCGLELISKLRRDAALFFPSTAPYSGKGRPPIYGDRFNPQQIDAQYRISVETIDNVMTEIYQAELRHKHFDQPLNVVCILKTHLLTQKKSHVLLFSSDLILDAEKMIDYYSLRFQIEFNFRDAKQYWGLGDFMNVKQTPINTAANLSMFMVNVSAKLAAPFRLEQSEFSVLDLKAHYRGLKYLDETLKILPQKPEAIVIEQIAQHLGSIGAIHHTQPELNPG